MQAYQRSERRCGSYVIRRVPCFSGNAPTVYAVLGFDTERRYRWLNSFLTAARASAWAREQSGERQ